MTTDANKPSINASVLDTIRRGEVAMRPKWHFTLRAILAVSGVIIALLALMFAASFVIFSLRQTGAWYAPLYGLRGCRAFLLAVPWAIVAVAAVFLVALEILVRRYRFAYRKPLLFSLIGLILMVGIGSLSVEQTTLHQSLMRRAVDNHLPLVGSIYRDYAVESPPGVFTGTVKEIQPQGFKVLETQSGDLQVALPNRPRHEKLEDLRVDDQVMIVGEREGKTIRANGFRKISPKENRRLRDHSQRLERGQDRPNRK